MNSAVDQMKSFRNLPGVRKLVDDILIQAPTLEALKNRISALLQRCCTHHFTLSQKKFEIGCTVNFAGFVVSRDGVFPNPDKLQGIRDFSSPFRRLFLALIPWHDKPAKQFLPCTWPPSAVPSSRSSEKMFLLFGYLNIKPPLKG